MTLEERFEALGGVVRYREIASGRFLWLTDTMMKTEGARARLRRWAHAGCPAIDPADLCCVADCEIERVAAAVVARIPVPVAHHVVRNVLTFGITHDGGFCGALPRLTANDESRQVATIARVSQVMSDAELAGIIAHEFAHAWTREVVAPDEALTPAERLADGRRRAEQLSAAGQDTAKAFISERWRSEWLAATLAAEWGFSGFATDPKHTTRGVPCMELWGMR